MKKVLLLGDFHVPNIAAEPPEEIYDVVEESDVVICTGDLGDDRILDELMLRSDKFYAVGGEDDYIDLPEQDVFEIEGIRFGLLHGDKLDEFEGEDEIDQMIDYGDMINVEFLVTGHTHQPFKTEREGLVLLNPGSVTGVTPEKELGGKSTYLMLHIDDGNVHDISLETL